MRQARPLQGFGALPAVAGTTAAQIQNIISNYKDVSALSINAIKTVIADKDTFNNLSPAVNNILLTLNGAANSIGITPSNTSGPDVFGDVITLAKAIAADLPSVMGPTGPGGGAVSAVADLFSGVGEAVAGIAEAVPIIGALLSIAEDIVKIEGVASGIGMCATDPTTRTTYCNTSLMNVVGTGPYNQMLPCDIFNCGYNGYGESNCASLTAPWWPGTALGQTIALLTENIPNGIEVLGLTHSGSDDFASVPSKEELDAFRAGNLTQFMAQNLVGQQIFLAAGATGGIPEATRTILKQLRLAMQHAYMTADGGTVLFPIYLDIILRQFKLNRLPAIFINTIMTLYGESCRSVTPDTCFNYNRKALDQFIGLVSGWDKLINSPYAPWAQQNAVGRLTEAQMLAAAKKALAPKPATVLQSTVCPPGTVQGTSGGFKVCIPKAASKLPAVPLHSSLSITDKVAVVAGAGVTATLLAILFFL